jgi:hypothetical protein
MVDSCPASFIQVGRVHFGAAQHHRLGRSSSTGYPVGLTELSPQTAFSPNFGARRQSQQGEQNGAKILLRTRSLGNYNNTQNAKIFCQKVQKINFRDKGFDQVPKTYK